MSFATTVRQPPATAGRTHASSVIPVVRSSVAESATATHALVPLKLRALLNLPVVTQAAFVSVPMLPRPDWSAVVVPVPSSNAHAPTSPTEPVLETVTGTLADVVVLPAPSRATAVSVCGPFAAAKVSQLIEYGDDRVLGAEVGAVELELDAGNRAVVGRGRGHRHGAGDGCARSRRGDRDGRRRRVGGGGRARLVPGGADVAGDVLGRDLVVVGARRETAVGVARAGRLRDSVRRRRREAGARAAVDVVARDGGVVRRRAPGERRPDRGRPSR